MGHDDLRTPVQPAGSQDPRGSARVQMVTARGTRVQGSAQCIPENSIMLSQMGQQISHRNFQAAGTGANQNHAVKNALRCDKTWEAHSDRNLPIPASIPEPTFSEQDMHFMQSVEDSGSCLATTLPMNVIPYSSMPMTSTTTVLESPMVSTTASFQGLPVMSVPELQPQLLTQQNIQQQQDASYQTEPASLEDLMNDGDEAMPMDAMCGAATPAPQFNQCPTGTGGGSAGGGSQAESGSGGQSTFVTGYSSQNFGPSMVAGGNGGGGLGGSGGDDDPFNNNRPIQLQRDHYADGNVLVDSDAEELLRFIEGDFEEMGGTPGQAFIPTLQTSEIFSEIDNLSGVLATTPGDNMMGYYSKFDLSGGGLQPMEESSISSDPVPATPQAPHPVPISTTPVSVPVSDSIGNSFDMIKLMKKQKKVPVLNRPSDLTFQPPSPAGSYVSAPSPTPSTPYPIQVSTPQRQEALPLQLPQKPQQQQERAPSMPPPSPASPPTPVNVRPFDCRRYEENGKMYLEMLVRKDLPEADRRFTLTAFFHAAQFCMDLGETMRDPCDLKVSNHVCANICDFRFDSEQSKLVFSIPSDCKHVNQWLTERGAAASFLDRHTILQQVLNTMATIHNKNRDTALWGCFMVFVAPDLRVNIIPDIVPMLCKMQATFGDQHFNPRFEDSRAVFELYERLIPPTINQNSSWISPGVNQLLESFSQLIRDPSSVFRMAEIARILGEKMMCKMEVDYLGLNINIFCVEHELVLKALSSIQSMIPDGATIVWIPSGQPVAIQDLATAVRPMRLGVTGVFFK